MQLAPQKTNIIDKILRDKNGRVVRATFCLYESNGRVKARLLKAVLVDEAPVIENKTLSLSGTTLRQSTPKETIFQKAFISPYFNSNPLYFSGSKPRAPTYTN